MQFDAALAAQDTCRRAELELGSDWDTFVELEDIFSSHAGIITPPPPCIL